jgi:predicted nucleic-acid-binding Zn-ribbon protein
VSDATVASGPNPLRGLTAAEVEHFAEKGLRGFKCVACGNTENLIIDYPGSEETPSSSPAIPTVTLEQASRSVSSMPVITVVCEECGHADFYALGFVVRWLERNPRV